MFDDPGKALRHLEEELRAAEQEEEWEEYTPTRAEGFSRSVYADESFDEVAALTVNEEKPAKKTKKKKRKKKGIKDLVFLAFLEILGILAIIGWWLR